MTQTDTTVELTREELIAEVERAARRVFGISAAELAKAYRLRLLAGPGRVAEAIALLNLLPDDDPLFEG